MLCRSLYAPSSAAVPSPSPRSFVQLPTFARPLTLDSFINDPAAMGVVIVMPVMCTTTVGKCLQHTKDGMCSDVVDDGEDKG